MFKRAFQMMLLGLALSVPVQVFGANSYGPVSRQETLWSIASRLRPSNQVTVQQTMLALYHKNPRAFAGNNINSLLKGARLQVPNLTEIRRYSRIAALRETHRQNTYWKRGIALPKSSPPPLSTSARKTVSAVDQRLRQEVASLKQQLKSEQAKSRQLSAELQALQAQVVEVSKTQAITPAVVANAATVPKPETSVTPSVNASIARQVNQLKDELADLRTVLDQKDNHIKTLQSSLKSASEAIKSQHADNMRLYDKLKEVSPASLPATPASVGKPVLKLADVNAATTESTATAATTAIDVDKETDSNEGKVWADDVVAAPKSVPLSTLLNKKPEELTPSSAAAGDGSSRTGISPLALAIALISFLFILALVWRAYWQQRALRRIEAEETARAEKMRKRLAENATNPITREKEQALPQTELNF